MTQLLLFDEPASSSIPTVVAPAEPQQLATPSRSPNRPESPQSPKSREADAGMHRMGDLARLVLLRYEMVAARRAKRLRTQPAPAPAINALA